MRPIVPPLCSDTSFASRSPPIHSAAATLATAQTFVYPTPAECASSSYRANGMTLAASKDTIHWGYTYKGLPHKMVAKSGDVVTVEM